MCWVCVGGREGEGGYACVYERNDVVCFVVVYILAYVCNSHIALHVLCSSTHSF